MRDINEKTMEELAAMAASMKEYVHQKTGIKLKLKFLVGGESSLVQMTVCMYVPPL